MSMEYRVKAEYLGGNPDFDLEKEEQEGIECKGYLLIAFKENNEEDMSLATSAHNITIDMIAKFLEHSDSEMKYDILQAALIAYGNIQARRLYEEQQKMNAMKGIFGMMGQRNPMEGDN